MGLFCHLEMAGERVGPRNLVRAEHAAGIIRFPNDSRQIATASGGVIDTRQLE